MRDFVLNVGAVGSMQTCQRDVFVIDFDLVALADEGFYSLGRQEPPKA